MSRENVTTNKLKKKKAMVLLISRKQSCFMRSKALQRLAKAEKTLEHTTVMFSNMLI